MNLMCKMCCSLIFVALMLCILSGSVALGADNSALINAGVEEIVFASRQLCDDGHWYANFGYYAADANRKAYRARGRLNKLNVRTGEVTILLDDPKGTIRDPQVHYDAERIVFSYRKGGSENFHLYEINVDGSGLKQLTDGKYDDLEPTYVADGGIIFVSGRCKRWVNCWLTQVAILYRCDGDGGNVRPISSNNEQENTPWPLPDGRILYQRWEYVDRSQVHYHHLWTSNPDGTGQMVYYGNMHPGTVMIDAKPIPGTEDVLSLFSPGHGKREHEGAITVVSAKKGPDDLGSARRVSKRDNYRDPYPLSADLYLAAQGTRLLTMDSKGVEREVYRIDSEQAKAGVQPHEPRPIIKRQRERVMADKSDLSKDAGYLVLEDIYRGRNMAGVKRGDIKKLLVLETLPMPIHYSGGMEPISMGGTFTLPRILGTVPVEEDGSAYMELPPLRSLFFVALDENDDSVKRMQSYLMVMPGETTSCVGCHERRTSAPPDKKQNVFTALKREASKITPLKGIPEVFDFPRDIQPILDKHCVACHDYDATDAGGPRAGRAILTGDNGPMYSQSYFTLTSRGQFADGRNKAESNLRPRTIGAVASKLMKYIAGEHFDVNVSAHQRDMIRYWIEAGAPYPGTYAAPGGGMIGDFYENQQVHTDRHWDSAKAAAVAINRRCGSCHRDGNVLPRTLSGQWNRDLMFNLTRPEKSLILLGPLAKDAGGYGLCRNAQGPVVVFANKDDADYQKILMLCVDGKKHLDEITRFDMDGFKPPKAYVREMKRYGILPVDTNADDGLDVYALDRAYWESLWHKPQDFSNKN